MFLIGWNPIVSWFNNTIHHFLLWVDETIYWFAAQCYQLFMKLATAQIFEDSFFNNFASRIYALLGIFMLFYLVYALLNAIVDPDKLTKGDKSAGKVAVNLVTSLVLLGLLPSIFTYAYRMQNFILSSNLLGAVILGSDVVDVSDTSSDESLIRFGDYVSFNVLNAFLNPENLNPTLSGSTILTKENWDSVRSNILNKGDWDGITLLANAVSSGVSIDGQNVIITYHPIISTLAGAFLVYMLLSFTLDLGVRVVKFAFYQLLAPIPIILRIIPSKKGTFDKWLKQTISVYFEVFVRIGLMYIVIYFINAITSDSTIVDTWLKNGGTQGKLAFAIVIMGIFAFAKQAPKIISDVLGIETGNLKLGIGEKLKAGGFFGAGAAVGSLISSGFNPFAAARGWRAGNKDGNFKQIGKEAQLRRKVATARKNGGNWFDRRINDVREYFGDDTTADMFDRKIENEPYKDLNGKNMKAKDVREMQERYNSNKAKIAEWDGHKKAKDAAHAVIERGKTLANRTDSSFTADLKDSNGRTVMNGNLATMKEMVNKLREKDMSNATDAEMANHARTINLYDQEISKIEKDLVNSIITDGLNNINSQDGDVELKQSLRNLEYSNSSLTHDITTYNDGAGIRDLEKKYNQTVFDNTYAIEQDNADIDRIENNRKQRQEELKKGWVYTATSSDRDVKK